MTPFWYCIVQGECIIMAVWSRVWPYGTLGKNLISHYPGHIIRIIVVICMWDVFKTLHLAYSRHNIDAGLVVASSSLCVLSITGQDWLCRHMQGCLAKWQRSMEHGTQARAFHATPDEGPGTEVRACAIPPVTQLEVQLTVCTFARIFIFVNGINSTTDDGYIMKSPYK